MGEGRWKGQGGMEKEKLWSECIIKGKINNEKKRIRLGPSYHFLKQTQLSIPGLESYIHKRARLID